MRGRPLAQPGSDRDSLSTPPRTFYARVGKRAFDLTVGLLLGLATLPVQLVLAVLVRKNLGSPVLFRQERPGLDCEPFNLLKFRTMTDERGPDGQLLPDEDRLPPFGSFLRQTSLDELPELLNVIRGDMSLVGPRPLLMSYLSVFTPEQARRQTVRPGITGWAQVNGRNDTSWQERFAHDNWYVRNLSFGLDLRIIARTMLTVVNREGVYNEALKPYDQQQAQR